jgi:hypothetical protein
MPRCATVVIVRNDGDRGTFLALRRSTHHRGGHPPSAVAALHAPKARIRDRRNRHGTTGVMRAATPCALSETYGRMGDASDEAASHLAE